MYALLIYIWSTCGTAFDVSVIILCNGLELKSMDCGHLSSKSNQHENSSVPHTLRFGAPWGALK